MCAVFCSSAQCKKNGNGKREIRVWGTGSEKPKRHKFKCPRCGEEIVRNIELGTVLKITVPK